MTYRTVDFDTWHYQTALTEEYDAIARTTMTLCPSNYTVQTTDDYPCRLAEKQQLSERLGSMKCFRCGCAIGNDPQRTKKARRYCVECQNDVMEERLLLLRKRRKEARGEVQSKAQSKMV